jgi:hypothetical protein
MRPRSHARPRVPLSTAILTATVLCALGCPSTHDISATVPEIPCDSARIPPVQATTVVGADWTRFATPADLRSARLFWWVDSDGRDVYQYVDLQKDPFFGTVARIAFPQNSGAPGSSPRIGADLPQPLGKMWLRWRMKFEPGWTTVGPDPEGAANSYKLAFWMWKDANGRGELQYSNTGDYLTGTGVQDPETDQYLPYVEEILPGSAPNFGQVDTEWNDGQWYEFVVYYEKTGPTTARQHYWRRRLTTGGCLGVRSWTYHGYSMSGYPTPLVRSVQLGVNKNKNNPTTMHLYWGPWEVVDGSKYPNPFGVPGLSAGRVSAASAPSPEVQ